MTTQSSGATARTRATSSGSSATGAATIASSAPARADSRSRAGVTASRSAATASASGSGSQPETSATPARRAASAADAPISPVPITEIRRMTPMLRLFLPTRRPSRTSHELGDPEGEVERLADVEAWVAEGLVAVLEMLLDTSCEPPRHSVTSSPVISRCTPPGHVPTSRWAAKKPSISRRMSSKRRVLCPFELTNPLACIGSQIQSDGVPASRAPRAAAAGAAPAPGRRRGARSA